jgi:hypothetical protein
MGDRRGRRPLEEEEREHREKEGVVSFFREGVRCVTSDNGG